MAHRTFRGILAACSISALAACGGTKHIGEITPPVVQRLSGEWTFNAQESDDPEKMAQERRANRRGGDDAEGRRGGERGGGGRGGMGMPPGGGMGGMGGMGGGRMGGMGGMGGRGGQGGGRMDPAAMQALRRMAMTTPTRLDIQLADSAVTVAYAGVPEPFVLPFGKKVERKLGQDLTLEAKASWVENRVVVERSVGGSGSITETFMPSVDGKRLTVDVLLGGGPGGGLEFQRVYDRGEGRGASGRDPAPPAR